MPMPKSGCLSTYIMMTMMITIVFYPSTGAPSGFPLRRQRHPGLDVRSRRAPHRGQPAGIQVGRQRVPPGGLLAADTDVLG